MLVFLGGILHAVPSVSGVVCARAGVEALAELGVPLPVDSGGGIVVLLILSPSNLV